MTIKKVKFSKSSNKKNKMMAEFYDENDKKVKTTHFGALGYSDYTIHKNKERRYKYMIRHHKREDWEDPTSAGALSLYILWGPSTSVKECINYFTKHFKLELVH